MCETFARHPSGHAAPWGRCPFFLKVPMNHNSQSTSAEIRAAQRIGLIVMETIIDADEMGAPSGLLYAALMSKGCSLSQYQSLMAPLERRGFVTLSGDCYHSTPAGVEFAAKLRKVLGVEP